MLSSSLLDFFCSCAHNEDEEGERKKHCKSECISFTSGLRVEDDVGAAWLKEKGFRDTLHNAEWQVSWYKMQLHFGSGHLYESSLQLLWLLSPRQHQVSAGVVHAQVVDVQAGPKHCTQTLHPAQTRTHSETFKNSYSDWINANKSIKKRGI